MIQIKRKSALLVTVLASALVCAQAGASSAYATIEGTIQGVLKGDAKRAGLENKTEVLRYEYSVSTPVSASTARVTHRREHGPVRITKVVGPASPQLFKALITNETLKSVVIDFLSVNLTSGQEYLATQVRLSNAKVVAIEQRTESADETAGPKHPDMDRTRILEEVAFTFATIEITSHDGKTSAVDSGTP